MLETRETPNTSKEMHQSMYNVLTTWEIPSMSDSCPIVTSSYMDLPIMQPSRVVIPTDPHAFCKERLTETPLAQANTPSAAS